MGGLSGEYEADEIPHSMDVLEEQNHSTENEGQSDDASFNEDSTDSPRRYNPHDRVYSYKQLEVLNLVVHPIWIFDYVERRMRWANEAGFQMWNAKNLEELQQRSFQEISDASAKRMEEYMSKFEEGIHITDQWTNYPNGKATTVHMNVSGIKFEEDGDKMHFCVMCEGVPLVKARILQANTRGVEMLRHLPMAVAQFDMDGKVMFQNPEATLLTKNIIFEEAQNKDGCSLDDSSINTLGDSTRTEVSHGSRLEGSLPSRLERSSYTGSSGSSTNPRRSVVGHLLQRFADQEVGRELLNEIKSTESGSIDTEAMIRTRKGTKWCALQLRKAHDPVTSEEVILYSASDKTDAIKARQEKKAREQKSEFLAIMAHEIRTPLHQVAGFIDLLDQTNLDSEQKGFVKLLRSSAQGLMTVISDVLDYSKLEAGKVQLEDIPYEPLSVVEGSMAAIRVSCEEKGLSLTLDWDNSIPFRLMGDPNRLRQILLNLLSNAIKFTNEGAVSIKTFVCEDVDKKGRKKTMIRYEVTDTGLGISDESKAAIFRKYQQADASISRNFGGTGLGLSICRFLAQNMGGSIGVDSVSGKGSTFWFTLPADVPSENEEITTLLPEEEIIDKHTLRILIVEDNKINQKLLSKMLQRIGHSSDLALNGKEAISMIESNDYDLILMDIQMPVMDGLEATRRLRRMGYNNLIIYGLTASVARSDFTELGFDDWLPKPTPMKDLKQKLNEVSRRING